MSRRVNGVPVVAAEPPLICFECGKIAETRPYGPNGGEICHECAMADVDRTQHNMMVKLFGAEGPLK